MTIFSLHAQKWRYFYFQSKIWYYSLSQQHQLHIKGSKFWQFSNILTIFGRILSLHMQKKLPIKILILLFLWPPCLYTDIIFLPCGFYFSFFLSAKLCGIEQRAPPIFRRAAITLGIGPHSSWPFLANVNSRSRSLYAVARPSVCRLSVCRLSVVGNAHAPYSGGSNFRQYFYGIWYPSHPFTSTENFRRGS